MKKNYKQPQSRCAEFDCSSLIAESFRLFADEDYEISDSKDILVKENKDVNLWNNEW